ncbi:hypothetical protein D3C76_1157770 [compost metagenome]
MAVLLSTGKPSFSYKITPNCFGEPRLNSSPAMANASRSSATSFSPNSTLCTPSRLASTNAPWRSMRARTGISGISMSLSTVPRLGVAASFSCKA